MPSNDLNLLPKDLRKEYEAEVAEYEGLIGGDSLVIIVKKDMLMCSAVIAVSFSVRSVRITIAPGGRHAVMS